MREKCEKNKRTRKKEREKKEKGYFQQVKTILITHNHI